MTAKKGIKEVLTIDRKLDRILREAFYLYYLLTPEQISRLLYTPSNLTTVESYLRDLLAHDYLYRFKFPTSEGKRPFIYTLAKEGRKYISNGEGLDRDVFYIPDGQEQRNYMRLIHFLELNDFLIDAKLLEKKRKDIELFDMQHDVLLQKEPVIARTSEGKRVKVTPDGILDFRVSYKGKEKEVLTVGDAIEEVLSLGKMKREGYSYLQEIEKAPYIRKKRICIWVELDRGWHSIRSFKEKIRALLTIYETGVDVQRFGTSRITYAFPTTAGESRVEKMRMWTRQELGTVNKDDWKNRMFCFAAVPALNDHKNMDVETLFCSSVWYMPYGESDEKRALIEL